MLPKTPPVIQTRTHAEETESAKNGGVNAAQLWYASDSMSCIIHINTCSVKARNNIKAKSWQLSHSNELLPIVKRSECSPGLLQVSLVSASTPLDRSIIVTSSSLVGSKTSPKGRGIVTATTFRETVA